MTLLTEVMERPLDPGYAAAARRRAEGGEGPGRRPAPGRTRRRLVTGGVAVLVGALLTAAILDLRLPGTTSAREVLLEEIEQRTEAADSTAARVEQLRAEVEDARSAALGEEDAAAVEAAERLGVLSGALPVAGPGVVVTVDDAPVAEGEVVGGDPRESEVDEGRVQDRDLQIVVNGLWAAGAEAVSVGGQRLTSLTSIRAAGDAVLVGFRPLTPPYRIEAVGDPQRLQTAFAESTAGRYLAFLEQNYGISRSVAGEEDLQLPGAGPLRLRWARPQEPSPVPSTARVPSLPTGPPTSAGGSP